MKKYRVEIEGHTQTIQYAIIEARSKEEAITLFNSGEVECQCYFEDFEPNERAEPVVSIEVE